MPTEANRSRKRLRASADLVESYEFVDLGPGLQVKRELELALEDEDLDATATATLVFDPELGRYDVKDLKIMRGPAAPPMPEVMRRFRLATLVDRFAMFAVKSWTMTEVAPGVWSWIGTQRLDDEPEENYVARIYRMATAAGYRPNKAVAEQLGVAPSTATKKVWLARKLGLLPKTQRGKARNA